MRIRHRGGDGGFTLAEILTATAIIAVGLVATAVALQHGISGIELGRGESTATFLAEHTLEELKGLALVDWTNARLQPGTTTEYCQLSTTIVCTATAPATAASFRRTITVVDGVGGPCSAHCKTVSISVVFRALSGIGQFHQQRRVDIATMFVARS